MIFIDLENGNFFLKRNNMTINMNDFFKSIERHCAIINIHFLLATRILFLINCKVSIRKKYFQAASFLY